MSYKVFIQTGSKKNKTYTSMGSVPLSSRKQVIDYVRRNRVGNSRTNVNVKNLVSGKDFNYKKIAFRESNSRLNFD